MRRLADHYLKVVVVVVVSTTLLFGAHDHEGGIVTVTAHGLAHGVGHDGLGHEQVHRQKQKATITDAHRKRDRIKVPLGRRLVDAIADNDNNDNDRQSGSSIARKFEIEVHVDDDDDTTNGAKQSLLVEEVQQHRMAVTSQTTYSFHESRNFNPDKIKDIAVLASNPKEVEGLTIMSIDKSTGDVRGIQRGNTGQTRQIIYIDDDDDDDDDDDRHYNYNEHKSKTTGGRKLRLKKMERRLGEELPAKNWSCDAAHKHDDDDNDDIHLDTQTKRSRSHHSHSHSESYYPFENNEIKRDFSSSSNSRVQSSPSSPGEERISSSSSGQWIEPPKYSFHVDLSIDIDKYFIQDQGSAEAAVEYINFLIGAANVIYEHEVDTHLNIVHIGETDLYDTLETTKEALRAQRLYSGPNTIEGSSGIILHHALLGRYLGGGIAFIDSICDKQWGYGVTSDISGKLSSLDELVLFDFFIVTHEIGHSLGSGHTFDAYSPPVDVCGACTVKPAEEVQAGASEARTIEGLPRENSATIMSYCNFCDGGLSNIAITLGGVWDGAQPRTDIAHWQNHPDIVGSVSNEPRRVSHNIWETLDSKGECVHPPKDPLPSQGCNDDDDCDDQNSCTVDVCNESTNLCSISDTLDNCCGNGKCEPGEGQSQSCPSDCGPFTIKSPNSCNDCHALDGFMIDVGLSDKAEKRIFVSSITLAYASPKNDEATIDAYVSTEGSYVGKETSVYEWERIRTVNVDKYNPKRGTHYVEIETHYSIPVGIGDRRGFYFAASEDIIMFDEGVYNIRNDRGVELHSSRAVSGKFGDGIDGFSLDCEVSYVLDDSSLDRTVGPFDPNEPELADLPSDALGSVPSPPSSSPGPPTSPSATPPPSVYDQRKDKSPRTPIEETIEIEVPSSSSENEVGGGYTEHDDHITWYPPLDGTPSAEAELDYSSPEEAVGATSSDTTQRFPLLFSSCITMILTMNNYLKA